MEAKALLTIESLFKQELLATTLLSSSMCFPIVFNVIFRKSLSFLTRLL